MKQRIHLFLFLSIFLITSQLHSQESTTMRLFEEVLFYDGYDSNIFDKDVEDGVLRHSNSLYSVKMTPEQLASFGDSVTMNVWIKACCDNYDRIGNINLAFVPKDEITYIPNEVMRIELGRFITPFMDKNKIPDTVPYTFEVDYLSYIFRDNSLLDHYDYWIEFELFGVPYAANTQIRGCKDRSDVFYGTLEFTTSSPAQETTDNNVLIPVVIKHDLNNYSESGTDTLGMTIKTYEIEIPTDVEDGQLVLVTSNHGANAGGEEYNRRMHYIYWNNELIYSYKPGRQTCEPFRKYNTQANGIYGYFKQSDETWQSFSNWCPGDVIDNRIMNLGALKAGKYTFTISVPDAQFVNKEGYFPTSLFFQGLKEGQLPDRTGTYQYEPEVGVIYQNGVITIQSEKKIISTEIYNAKGIRLYHVPNFDHELNISTYSNGIYLIHLELEDGIVEVHKILKSK